MSFEDLFPLRHRHHEDAIGSLSAQLEQLRRDFGHIGRALSREARDNAGDFGREAAKQGAWLAGVAGRKAVRGARAIRHDPLPAIAILGTAFLVAHLLTGRK